MQDHDHPAVDFTPLWQSIIDSLADNVDKLITAATLGAVAMIGRHFALKAAVKREAIAAERDIGNGHGSQKHERVKRVIKETWPMSRISRIDTLIKTTGKAAADKDREHRESLMPPPPSDGSN